EALPSSLLDQATTEVLLVAALHHDHLGRGLRIIDPRRHHHVKPLKCRLANRIRFRLLDVVWVIADDAITTLAGGSTTHGGRQAVTRSVVVEAALRVLVAGEGEAIGPTRLIPGRFDQSPAFDRIPDAELGSIAAVQPPSLGPGDPFPRRPKH